MGCPNCTRSPGVVGGHVEHRLGQAQGEGGDRDTTHLQRPQELAQPHVGVPDQLLGRDPHVVEVQLTGIEPPPTDSAHLGPHRETRRVPLHDEARVARRPVRCVVGTCQQGHAEGHVGSGVGDERLPPVDRPPTVSGVRPGLDAAGVGAGVRLGQAEGAEGSPLGERPQPPLALRGVPEQVQRQRADGDVCLQGRRHRLVGQPDLLHGRDEPDRRHPDPAPFLWDQHAEQAECSHLPQQVGRAACLLPRLWRPRGDLVPREIAAQPDQRTLGLAQGEVHPAHPMD